MCGSRRTSTVFVIFSCVHVYAYSEINILLKKKSMITLEEERAEEEEEEKILDRKAGYHSRACVTSSQAKEREKKT